jgi:protoporphyrinogen oxidase
MKRKHVLILGGGLAGLAAADRLVVDYKVTLIEKSHYLGGLAASFPYKEWHIPIQYHHVFQHDETTKHSLARFGLAGNITWKKIRMCIGVNERLYEFTNHRLLQFDYLSVPGRIRYGWFGFWATFLMNPSKIPDHVDARAWLTRHVGSEVTEKLFHELQARNKYGTPLDHISAKEFAYRIKEREFLGTFGYPTEGMQQWIDRMEQTLLRRECSVIKGADVSHIDVKQRTMKVNGKPITYDALITTIPLPAFLSLAAHLPHGYADRLSHISYCPAVTVAFGTRALLSDYYWHNLLKERIHIIMQHSWLYDGYDCKISWALRYGGSHEDLDLDDDTITHDYMMVVKKYFPDAEILWSKVFRERYASPIYDKEYSKHKPDYRSPVPGLYHAGVAVTYPKIRNMNTALESGVEAARLVAEDLGRPKYL